MNKSSAALKAKNTLASLDIVIPTYNDSHLLERCLDSILNQSIAPNFIFVIDDGSTNNEAEKVSKLKKFSNLTIKFHKIKNGGPSRARNFGFSQSTSKHILFLDADDCLEAGAIESYNEKISLLRNTSFGIFGRIEFNDKNCRRSTPQIYFNKIDKNQIGRKNLFEVHISSIMFVRSFFEDVNGFNESLTHNEDFDLILRLMKRGEFESLPNITLRKNFRDGSQSNKDYVYSYYGVRKFLLIAQEKNLLSEDEIIARNKENLLSYGKNVFLNLEFKAAKEIFIDAFSNIGPKNLKEYACFILSKVL